jgi:hypothetical protein
MNMSKAVFILNDAARGINCSYEPNANGSPLAGKSYTFKTLDPNIAVGDLVVVPTDTRYNFTVVKVVEVDVDVDLDDSVQLKWIVDKVDIPAYESLLKQEEATCQKLRSAELLDKRKKMREKLFADQERLKGLPLANMEGGVALPAPEKDDGPTAA